MLFEAPDIIRNIPDIAEIYRINDKQIDELEQAAEQLDKDIFLTTMGEDKAERWEKMLGITVFDDDTIEDRRFRIQARVLEKLPYSYRVLIRKINALTSGEYNVELSNDRLEISINISLVCKNAKKELEEMLENTLPLNMLYSVKILYNTWKVVLKSGITWNETKDKKITWKGLREEVLN